MEVRGHKLALAFERALDRVYPRAIGPDRTARHALAALRDVVLDRRSDPPRDSSHVGVVRRVVRLDPKPELELERKWLVYPRDKLVGVQQREHVMTCDLPAEVRPAQRTCDCALPVAPTTGSSDRCAVSAPIDAIA